MFMVTTDCVKCGLKVLQAGQSGKAATSRRANLSGSPINRPVIDRKDRLLLAFGHQHLGLTQAALTAELVSALYHDEIPALDLTPYRLARFG